MNKQLDALADRLNATGYLRVIAEVAGVPHMIVQLVARRDLSPTFDDFDAIKRAERMVARQVALETAFNAARAAGKLKRKGRPNGYVKPKPAEVAVVVADFDLATPMPLASFGSITSSRSPRPRSQDA